ncbi:hypothetical protein [Oryza sativa Japonica Group]|uniref:Uncharacterized protein P0460H02.13 n=1 Tax=Oryza sativa subsp. japonica TaxID=39947 RepID=Q5ZC27_ORYSJ|nr:hypothetical protein [Oryza sativa Japonica Group]
MWDQHVIFIFFIHPPSYFSSISLHRLLVSWIPVVNVVVAPSASSFLTSSSTPSSSSLPVAADLPPDGATTPAAASRPG